MENSTQVKSFDVVTGLGTISFSHDLVTSIIKKVFSYFPEVEYVSHYIAPVSQNYYEVSVSVSLNGELKPKVIDKLQQELLLVMKQSLSLTCAVVINIHGK